MNNFLLLAKIRIDESMDISRFRYTKDKGEKLSIVLSKVIKLLVFIALFAIITFIYQEIANAGMASILLTCSYFLASVVSFILTIVNMNDVLTGNDDSEYLLSTPMSTMSYVAMLFLTLYVRSFVFVFLISAPAAFVSYPYVQTDHFFLFWFIGLLFTSLPMSGIAAIIGVNITLILATSPKKNQIYSAVSILCITLGILFVFLLTTLIGPALNSPNLNASEMSEHIISTLTHNAKFTRFYYMAIVKHDIPFLVLFLFASAIWYVGFSFIIAVMYRIFIVALQTPVSYKEYAWQDQKAKPIAKSIFHRELDQFIRSKSYLINSTYGIIIGLVLSIGSLISKDSAGIFSNATSAQLLCFLCFLVALSNTSYCAESLDGRRHWILQTAPLNNNLLFHSKVKVNLLFTLPMTIIIAVIIGIITNASILEFAMYLVIPSIYAFINALWGAFIGHKYASFSKESEAQVLHSGTAYFLGFLPGAVIPALIFLFL